MNSLAKSTHTTSLPRMKLEHFARTKIDWTPGITKNGQTHRVCLRGASLGLPMEVTMHVVQSCVIASGGKLVPRDIQHQCESAYRYVTHEHRIGGRGRLRSHASKPARNEPPLDEAFDRTLLARCAKGFPGLVTPEWLKARSSDWVNSPFEFLRVLFPPRPGHVALVFDSMSAIRPLNARLTRPYPATLSGRDGIWFLSNAVDGRAHLSDGGRPSWRCHQAVSDFRHLVLECDHEGPGVAEDWMRFLVQLPMPIRAIYTSGGKSVHALVAINAKSKSDWDHRVGKLKRRLTERGADHKAMSAVRLTRLPFCFRESKSRWQELLYLRPSADNTPIASLGGAS